MTDKEAFKIGFLMKCAEEGLTPSQVEERITHRVEMIKKAESVAMVKKADSNSPGLVGTGWDVLKTMLGHAWPLAVAAPWVAGGVGGYALSKAQDDVYDVDEAKKREEIAEYYRAIDQLNRASRTKRLEFS